MISTGPVLGNISRILTRYCILWIACAENWDEKNQLDSYCVQEILFWKENISNMKVRNCFVESKPHCIAYSDASSTGCGAIVALDQDHICHRLWEVSEISKSSTW